MDALLEKIAHTLRMTQDDFPFLLSGIVTILASFTILVLGWMIAKIVRRIIRKSTFGGNTIDATLRPVLASTIFYIIVAMTLYAFLTKLGIPATSLLAIFGAAGLAIGLALKDTLSNIASGVMMITLRPLQVGEAIDTPNAAGTVIEIGLFATTVKDPEGVFMYIPNSQMWHSRVTNFGRHKERKLVVDIRVSYAADLKAVQDILLGVMNDNSLVQKTPAPPDCFVMNFEGGGMLLSCRCWLPADDWSKNGSDMRIAFKSALDEAGIDIAVAQSITPQRAP